MTVPSRRELRRRLLGDVTLTGELPAQATRRARPLGTVRIDGRELEMLVGARALGATLTRALDGDQLELLVDDHDGRALDSGLLGTRVASRVAQVTCDGLSYLIGGLGDPDGTGDLKLTCEPALQVALKRHGRDRPVTGPTGASARQAMLWCAGLIRQAGQDVIVVGEDADAKDLPAITRARRDRAERPARRTRGVTRQRLTGGLVGTRVNGYRLSAEGASNARLARDVCRQEKAGPKATLALFEALIVEPAGYRGSGPFDNPAGGDSSSQGVLQLLDTTARGLGISARDARACMRLFLTRGFYGKGGAIVLARSGRSAGQVAQDVQGSAYPARYDQVRGDAQRVLRALGDTGQDDDAEGGGGSSGATAPAGLRRQRAESTFACCQRTLREERGIAFYLRETAWVIADERDLAACPPRLLASEATPELLGRPSWEVHRGASVQEANPKLMLAPYEVDQGDAAQVAGVPLVDGGSWIVESVSGPLGLPEAEHDVKLRMAVAAHEPPKETAPGDAAPGRVSGRDADETGGRADDLLERLERAARDLGRRYTGHYVWGGGHGRAGVPTGGGFDCSGLQSALLAEVGIIPKGGTAYTSDAFGAVLKRGQGRVTLWGNPGHAFSIGPGWRLETSSSGRPWFTTDTARSTAGFKPYKIA